ncbi:histidine kinase [Rhodobacteraceae bacterium CYK-10]|uniref:histidine kinase n=1 Tax=Stagnihabitans tardus TaxID=2699202 RepID=A0AAE4Y7C9_9RHOB|nr:sensor histidine kinase [Stagnihabitans tardus]NBZ87222.1 histidine kinase [Stagnihabitans tardus]
MSQKGDPKGEDAPGDLLLGEDWEAPEGAVEPSLRDGRRKRGLISLNHSPLARKIIVFNLMGLVVLVAGVLFMNPSRDSLVNQREDGLVNEARLIADVISAGLAPGQQDLARGLEAATVAQGSSAYLFDSSGKLLARAIGAPRNESRSGLHSTVITDFLNMVWDGISSLLSGGQAQSGAKTGEELVRGLLGTAQTDGIAKISAQGPEGGTQFAVAAPIKLNGAVVGLVGVTSAEGEIDRLVRDEREQILQMFVVAILVSIGLSLVLASTIANPLSDLAAAAEIGRDRDSRAMAPGRVRIPDLSARPDEIGRLSIAMRGMVSALYDRIDANEQFAADVSHEIKNPLASLRSAVGSLRMVKKEEHKEKLLDVIEHDVRRLDRLVSDISNASRLDSELVKEEEEEFNLLKTLTNLTEYLGQQAGEKGVEFITDFPQEPIRVTGLEARLAQVFVNLITNAISFCEEGDAVRVWARKRDNRVLIVVEDTGPGIPEQALTKIFKRFYSERPKNDFGNHSGLGLAISKQIIEAHGGVIWAENIRPTQADITSEPLGARFVVGLPV